MNLNYISLLSFQVVGRVAQEWVPPKEMGSAILAYKIYKKAPGVPEPLRRKKLNSWSDHIWATWNLSNSGSLADFTAR